MTRAVLDRIMRAGLQYGDPHAKRVYASPDAAAAIRDLEGCWQEATPSEDPDFWLLGAFGFRVPVYVRSNAAPGFLYVTE